MNISRRRIKRAHRKECGLFETVTVKLWQPVRDADGKPVVEVDAEGYARPTYHMAPVERRRLIGNTMPLKRWIAGLAVQP